MNQYATIRQAVAPTESCPALERCPVLVELRVVSEPETSPLPTAFAAPRGFIPESPRGTIRETSISELKSRGFRAPQGFLP